jgi:L-2-hydroxyglutarate oxidase LhgO
MATCDFLVIGGGVIGINIARELRRDYPDCTVTLIEKEPEAGLHASGRNSGVLHAGFYYGASSLKARFTRKGNLAMTEYCKSKGIPLNPCGKLVVAKNAAELDTLDELYRRGQANGVPLDRLSADDARKIEPRVKTHERALFSPSTTSVNPTAVVLAMKADALAEGVRVQTGEAYARRDGAAIVTSRERYEAGYVVNAAGLYADKIARDFGFSEKYRILPFKGLYCYSDEPAGSLRTNIYPVPDLRNPFLGVHFTVTADGHVKIGPTAIPAFWREQYAGLENFRLDELMEISLRQTRLFFRSDFDFKSLAFEELRKYVRSHLVKLAGELVAGVEVKNYRHWGKAGIRAQLLDIKAQKLEMDFVFEHDDRSMHVLNTVSPGFTCSIPFSRYICDHIRSGGRQAQQAG